MLSMNENVAFGSSGCSVAVYKGLTVVVYNVDKPEISLTSKDLVELINVCVFLFLFVCCFSHLHSLVGSNMYAMSQI